MSRVCRTCEPDPSSDPPKQGTANPSGRHLSLEQCFALELHLDRQWFERGDLIEGVRALLIDKDKTPRWNPPTLQALDAEHVASFFSGFDQSES